MAGTAQAQQSRVAAPRTAPVVPSAPPIPGIPPVPGAAAVAAPAQRGTSLAQASWTYEAPAEPKQFRLHDQITVMVSEKSVVESDGQIDRRKQANGKLTLEDWILLRHFSLIKDPQSTGDPKVSGSMENKYRAQADLQTRDSMTFKIACQIVDMRPNGTMVLEGRKSVYNNAESWEQCVTGVVRAEDVLPNNTVLSENVAELRIVKREAGHVRDGYRRGWLLQFLDRYQPF